MMRSLIFCLFLTLSPLFHNAYSQDDNGRREHRETVSNEFNIRVQKVRDSIFMLTGKGGNIGLCIGTDGTFLIDNQFAESTSNILNAVSNLTMNPVQFLVNTHHHGDHTGGNKNMREAGVTVFAHTNVRKRLFAEHEAKQLKEIEANLEKKLQKAKEDGQNPTEQELERERFVKEQALSSIDEKMLPMITFEDDLTFNYNDQEIMVFHVHNAHTDGDVLVYFTQSNVLHTGDAFVKDRYPFIDAANGGSFEGYIEGLEKILMLIDDETLIIPGHGSIAKLADVRYTKSMMDFVTNSVAYHRVEKKTEDQVAAMKDITKEYDAKGFGTHFISTDAFVRAAYKEAARKYQWIDKSKYKEKE